MRVVHANGFENMGVFRQAVFPKPFLVEFSVKDVTLFIVEHSTPAFVFPGRGSDEHSLAGEQRGGCFNVFPVKAHSFFFSMASEVSRAQFYNARNYCKKSLTIQRQNLILAPYPSLVDEYWFPTRRPKHVAF